jgi:hypothetical protein
MLQTTPPADASVLVIGTSSSSDLMGLHRLFQVHVELPRLDPAGTRGVLNLFKVFRVDGNPFYLEQTRDIPIKSLIAAVEHLRYLSHGESMSTKAVFATQEELLAALDMYNPYVPEASAVSLSSGPK